MDESMLTSEIDRHCWTTVGTLIILYDSRIVIPPGVRVDIIKKLKLDLAGYADKTGNLLHMYM